MLFSPPPPDKAVLLGRAHHFFTSARFVSENVMTGRKSIAKWSEMFLDSVVMMEEGMNITEYAIKINDEM